MLLGLAILLIIVLLVIGVSVPMAFGGVLLLIATMGDHNVAGFIATGHWKMNTVIIMVIPLFIIAGDLMQRGKIAAPIVGIAELMTGWIRGGLSAASVIASAMFGAISGSGAATLTLHRLDHDAASRTQWLSQRVLRGIACQRESSGFVDTPEWHPVDLRMDHAAIRSEVLSFGLSSRPHPHFFSYHREFRDVEKCSGHQIGAD